MVFDVVITIISCGYRTELIALDLKDTLAENNAKGVGSDHCRGAQKSAISTPFAWKIHTLLWIQSVRQHEFSI